MLFLSLLKIKCGPNIFLIQRKGPLVLIEISINCARENVSFFELSRAEYTFNQISTPSLVTLFPAREEKLCSYYQMDLKIIEAKKLFI